MDDKQKVQMLSYALGLAIGTLATINAKPYDLNTEELTKTIQYLTDMAATAIYHIDISAPTAVQKGEA